MEICNVHLKTIVENTGELEQIRQKCSYLEARVNTMTGDRGGFYARMFKENECKYELAVLLEKWEGENLLKFLEEWKETPKVKLYMQKHAGYQKALEQMKEWKNLEIKLSRTDTARINWEKVLQWPICS